MNNELQKKMQNSAATVNQLRMRIDNMVRTFVTNIISLSVVGRLNASIQNSISWFTGTSPTRNEFHQRKSQFLKLLGWCTVQMSNENIDLLSIAELNVDCDDYIYISAIENIFRSFLAKDTFLKLWTIILFRLHWCIHKIER